MTTSYSNNNKDEDLLAFPALEDSLEDVHARFILNLPPQELETSDRLFFQLEQAWWFYEDMICDQLDDKDANTLPRFGHLKPFCLKLFQWSPLLRHMDFHKMWGEFSQYKSKISTYGTILLNKECTHIILCQVWESNTWTFPAGKINQGEGGREAAARETFEESGFDPHCIFGLTKTWSESEDVALTSQITWTNPLQEQDAITFLDNNGKRRTCYVCCGVPADFPFAPVARKEVGAVQWFPLDNIPKKSFAVLPFFGKLRGWIKKRTGKSTGRAKSNGRDKSNGRGGEKPDKPNTTNPNTTTRDKSNPRQKSRKQQFTPKRINSEDNNLVDSGLAHVGDTDRWSEEDMFKTNEKLIGRKVDYDGNPHVFTDQGFGGIDPHAFRVVGGAFMNSQKDQTIHVGGSIQDLVALPPPPPQPLVHLSGSNNNNNKVSQLTPFFSLGGETPWGEVVEEAKGSVSALYDDDDGGDDEDQEQNNAGSLLLAMLHGKPTPPTTTTTTTTTAAWNEDEDPLDVLTDAQITKRSQERHAQHQQEHEQSKQERHEQYLQDMAYIQAWVQNLPMPAQASTTPFQLQINLQERLPPYVPHP
jgi:mRNA-decapping enzyme subunit 2